VPECFEAFDQATSGSKAVAFVEVVRAELLVGCTSLQQDLPAGAIPTPGCTARSQARADLLEAAHAASHNALRSQGLPAHVVPLFRFPAVWLLPGQTPAQLTRSAAEGNASTVEPTSATKVQARRCLMRLTAF
jgi:hypothetical protein